MAHPAIASLDNALAEAGEDVILRREVSVGNGNVLSLDVKCRAFVRTFRLREEELVSGISQSVDLVTISPTEIEKKQWPGGQLQGAPVSPSLPRKLDKLKVKGRWRTLDAVDPIAIGAEIVRINMQLLG